MNHQARRRRQPGTRKRAPAARAPAPSIADKLVSAVRLHQAGALAEAEALYREVLAAEPRQADVLNQLGVVVHQTGRDDDALDLIDRAIAIDGSNPAYFSNRGIVLRRLGRADGAVESYRRAVALKPDYAEAHYNMGNVLADQRRAAEALACYHEAVALRPDYARAHNAIGGIHLDRGRMDAAIGSFRQALQYAPDDSKALNNLGVALHDRGQTGEAIDCYRASVAHDPDNAEAFVNLVWARQEVCDWAGREPDLARLLEVTERRIAEGRPTPIDPFSMLSLPVSADCQLAVARAYAKRVVERAEPVRRALALEAPRRRAGRLRVGYLSADFHTHATAHLMQGLFALHDRDAFEIFAYSIGPDDAGDERRRIAGDCDAFVDLAECFDGDSARRIHADGIDILVDLKGYTSRARPGIPALRPAPVQVAYLGYPGTMGADFIDYVITDRIVTPPQAARFFSERFVYLPHSYQVNDHGRPRPAPRASRRDCGLPEDGFVFCCFNHAYKIEPVIFAAWMRILAATPGAVLWLLRSSSAMEENLRREAAAQGIAPERLVFAGRVPLEEHLARHRHADLLLDTHLYNSHTTASDALWMGLPVLTWPGETFASRVAASLLTAVGLPELVARDLAAYQREALRLVGDRDALAGLGHRLEANRTSHPLFDTPRFARNLERAYALMWEAYEAGGPPRELAVAEEG